MRYVLKILAYVLAAAVAMLLGLLLTAAARAEEYFEITGADAAMLGGRFDVTVGLRETSAADVAGVDFTLRSDAPLSLAGRGLAGSAFPDAVKPDAEILGPLAALPDLAALTANAAGLHAAAGDELAVATFTLQVDPSALPGPHLLWAYALPGAGIVGGPPDFADRPAGRVVPFAFEVAAAPEPPWAAAAIATLFAAGRTFRPARLRAAARPN